MPSLNRNALKGTDVGRQPWAPGGSELAENIAQGVLLCPLGSRRRSFCKLL